MKNIFTGLILFFAIQHVFAQTYNQATFEPDEEYLMHVRKSIMGIEYKNPIVGYKGKQFFSNWTYGEILLTDGVNITGLFLRYDEYMDQLLWFSESSITCLLCKTCIKGFSLYDDAGNIIASFIKKRVSLPLENDSVDCFFQTLVNGEYSFFAFRKVSRVPGSLKLVDDTSYYVFHNDQYKRIKLRTRDLLNVSFIDKVKMKSIIKSNKIRHKENEQEFIRAISIYNK